MSLHSIDLAPDQKQPPFAVEQLPPEVYATYDRDQIAELLSAKLVADGVDLESVVFSGFDAEEVLKQSGFGERSTTFAVSYGHLMDPDSQHSPAMYLEDNGASAPAIGVFKIDGLLGSDAEDPRDIMNEITPDELKTDTKLKYWATKDGSSLDESTVKLFLF